jgi:hypothetical protein
MSDLSVNSILDASGGATTTINGFTPTVSNMAGRNKIINGGMGIDQRATSVTGQNWTVDRYYYNTGTASKGTAAQSATAPTGFVNSLLFTSSSAYSVAVSDYFGFQQPIEGMNISDLAWGTADAKTVTLSFWVRSSLTGTFGGSLRNSGAARSYVFSYTISVADTWEYKTITILGDTSGTWLTTNGAGIFVHITLAAGANNLGTASSWSGSNLLGPTGQTSIVGTNGATFYITGVQLEAGSVATPFEHRQYGQELALCQRYYQQLNASGTRSVFAFGTSVNTTLVIGTYYPPVVFRAAPTLVSSSIGVDFGDGPRTASLAINSTYSAAALVSFSATATGLVANRAYFINAFNTAVAVVQLSAEL